MAASAVRTVDCWLVGADAAAETSEAEVAGSLTVAAEVVALAVVAERAARARVRLPGLQPRWWPARTAAPTPLQVGASRTRLGGGSAEGRPPGAAALGEAARPAVSAAAVVRTAAAAGQAVAGAGAAAAQWSVVEEEPVADAAAALLEPPVHSVRGLVGVGTMRIAEQGKEFLRTGEELGCSGAALEAREQAAEAAGPHFPPAGE